MTPVIALARTTYYTSTRAAATEKKVWRFWANTYYFLGILYLPNDIALIVPYFPSFTPFPFPPLLFLLHRFPGCALALSFS
eukprot:scaffold155593_cov33-Tisochrysis_lutea.AAC.3